MDTVDDNGVRLLELCRLCAAESDGSANIFEYEKNGKIMAEYLSECLGKHVDETDGYPVNICYSCIPKLMDTYGFLVTIKQSEVYFNKILHSTGKVNQKIANKIEQVPVETEHFDDALNDSLSDDNFDRDSHDDICTINIKPEELPIEITTNEETVQTKTRKRQRKTDYKELESSEDETCM